MQKYKLNSTHDSNKDDYKMMQNCSSQPTNKIKFVGAKVDKQQRKKLSSQGSTRTGNRSINFLAGNMNCVSSAISNGSGGYSRFMVGAKNDSSMLFDNINETNDKKLNNTALTTTAGRFTQPGTMRVSHRTKK